MKREANSVKEARKALEAAIRELQPAEIKAVQGGGGLPTPGRRPPEVIA